MPNPPPRPPSLTDSIVFFKQRKFWEGKKKGVIQKNNEWMNKMDWSMKTYHFLKMTQKNRFVSERTII